MEKPDLKPEIVPYSKLFFELGDGKLPSFRRLDELEFPVLEPDQDLPVDVADAITSELEPIHNLCRSLGHSPLITEFSLISDERPFGQGRESHFSSYMAFFLPSSRSVARAYAAALRHMAEGEQIVPHPELFSPRTGLVALDRASIALPGQNETSPTLCLVPHLTALRQTFQLIDEPEHSLDYLVSRFVDKFLENVAEHCADESAMLGRTLFLLLPFVRPHFQSVLSSPGEMDRQRFRGYPAGSLFLFLQPAENARSKEELARSLSWLLAESSLRESYATYAVEQSRNRAFATYNLAHPLKHRLGDLASDTRWLLESYDYKTDDFDSRLRTHQKLVEMVHSFAELCHLWHFAVVNGPERALCAQDTGGNLKFGAIGPLDLGHVLVEASKNPLLASSVNRKLELTYSQDFGAVVHGFSEAASVNGSVRLKDILYREMVFEVVSNALRHGRVIGDTIRVHAAIDEVKGDLGLLLSNSVSEHVAQNRLKEPVNDWTPWFSESPTGLTFVATSLQATGAGKLYYRHRRYPENSGEREFAVALVLRGLRNSS